MMNNNLKNITNIIENVWKIDKKWVIVTFIQNLLVAISNAISTALIAQIVYCGILGTYSFSKITVLVSLIGLFMLITCIFNSVYYGKYDSRLKEQILFKYKLELAEIHSKIPLKYYYNKKFLDIQSFVNENIEAITTGAVVFFAKYISNIISIVICIAVAAFWDLWVLSAFVLISPFMYKLSIKAVNIKNDTRKIISTNNRKKKIYHDYFFKKEFVDELRLYSISEVLNIKYREIANESHDISVKIGRRVSLLLIGYKFMLEILLYFGIILFMAYRVLSGYVTMDKMLPLTAVVYQLISRVNFALQIFPKMKELLLYYKKYEELLTYSEEKQDNIICVNDHKSENKYSIELRNVSFRYDDNQDYILKNINLKINNGEKIALIGKNGAGKSTIVKIILGLYKDYEGMVLINGKDIKFMANEEITKEISCVFQDFCSYSTSISENVALCKKEDINEAKVEESLKNAGLTNVINQSSLGVNSNLTKEFDSNGIVLSGGQNQKLAISRVFYKNSKIVILDEPTSSMDVMSEYEFFNNLRELYNGKTIIAITHRLFTIKDVDRIICIDKGEIIENGSHNELINVDGFYAKMYTIQKNKYNIGGN